MNPKNSSQKVLPLMQDAIDYWTDASQRYILFMDILRQRGNNFLENIQQGQPPVLTFDYEIIMDGRKLEKPVNHALARILVSQESGVRSQKSEANQEPRANTSDLSPLTSHPSPSSKRPIIIIDPRAGHGPGIGGSKQDSEIGMALKAGHPVYFILFYPNPEPNQTYSDVKAAQIRFIEEVKARHPDAEEPAVIGNCQAGWAVAILGADRPDITGPLVLNGSPLSYWSGVDKKNPMRYRAGLMGGIWLTSLLCDLGNGKFDGANLVMNFEDLNPANTYWAKQYNVWQNVDTEAERYLNFEKWWNSYFMMNSEEIRFILQNLFVGNRLEQGQLQLDSGEKIDLRNLEDPVVVFASSGDNITPPQQALNWITKVYGSVDEIRREQQVIIYRVHENVGHLGIFVSAKVARKEHHEVIKNIDMIEFLPPGLYEMIIEEGDQKLMLHDYKVRFEERDIKDILAMDDGVEEEEDFRIVATVSEMNDNFYQNLISPLIKMGVNNYSAEILKQLHPLRISRYAFSDKYPWMLPFKTIAPLVKANRKQVPNDNPFLEMEKSISESMITMLDWYRDIRDITSEFLFKSLYGNPFIKSVEDFDKDIKEEKPESREAESKEAEEIRQDKEYWISRMEKGGFVEGVARIMVALIGADKVFDRREMETCARILNTDERLKDITPYKFKRIIREQSRILQTDEDAAIQSLSKLIPSPENLHELVEMARTIAHADGIFSEKEEDLVKKIEGI